MIVGRRRIRPGESRAEMCHAGSVPVRALQSGPATNKRALSSVFQPFQNRFQPIEVRPSPERIALRKRCPGQWPEQLILFG